MALSQCISSDVIVINVNHAGFTVFILWRSWQSGARPIYESSCWQREEVDRGIWMMLASILGCNVGSSEVLAAEQRLCCQSGVNANISRLLKTH